VSLRFTHDALPGRVRFGGGVVAETAAEVDRLGATRVLLVSRRGSAAGVTKRIADDLGGRCVGWFDDVTVHVPGDLAAAAVDAARQADADALVCVGGGSAIGTAKIVARELGTPIVAVPTTYAGSEMTPIWGTTTNGRKTTGRTLDVLPRTVLYDPDLTRSLPPKVSASSGMNALAHSVEGLYAPASDPVVRLLALESIRVLHDGLPRVVANADDTAGRTSTLYGAYLAGAVLAGAGTSIHHTVAHILGGTWNLPHAPLHAILLPHTVAFAAPAVPAAMAQAADVLGAADVPAALSDLLHTLDLDRALTSIGMPAAAFDAAVDAVMAADPVSPRPVTRDAVVTLLRGAFDGTPPPLAE
jgi:maleylacetate reductase